MQTPTLLFLLERESLFEGNITRDADGRNHVMKTGKKNCPVFFTMSIYWMRIFYPKTYAFCYLCGKILGRDFSLYGLNTQIKSDKKTKNR
jgi:hypothetical protein